jgi:peroxiredoxin
MAPKRKTTAAPAARKKVARKGLAKGDMFPSVEPLPTDEGTTVDLNVRGRRRRGGGVRQDRGAAIGRRAGPPPRRETSYLSSTPPPPTPPLPHPPNTAPPPTSLQAIVQETGLLLFSYPKANTSGCTAQARGFSRNAAAVEAAGYTIFGISADKPQTQANWRAKEDNAFAFNLLSDPTHELALKKLGWSKGGDSVARSHMIVAKGGKILEYETPIKSGDSVAQGVLAATGKEAV